MKIKKKHSLLRRFLVPFVLLMIFQAGMFYFTTLWGGTVQKLNDNAYDIFEQKVIGRKNYIENDMITRWSNIEETANTVNSVINKMLEYEENPLIFIENKKNSAKFLSMIADEIVYMLRKNTVTGAFIMLDNSSSNDKYEGMYIRDLDPQTTSKDNSDLAMKNGSPNLYNQLGITTDIMWTPMFESLDKECSCYHNLTKIIKTARENPDISPKDIAAWSAPIKGELCKVVTYTFPLVAYDQTVYGVIGIDVSVDFLKKNLPYYELDADKKAVYCLAVKPHGEENYLSVATSGSTFKRYFDKNNELKIQEYRDNPNSYTVSLMTEDTVYGNLQPLQLYNTNTPSSGDKWAVIGIIPLPQLLSFSDKINSIVLISTMLSILTGIIFTCIISTILTNPIKHLITNLHDSEPSKPVILDALNISEIDELANAIEDLSQRVADSASMMQRMIRSSDIEMAAFEYDKETDVVTYTGNSFSLFGDLNNEYQNGLVSSEEFKKLFKNAEIIQNSGIVEDAILIQIIDQDRKFKWIKLTLAEEKYKTIGILIDYTEEVIKQRCIEYERDYDVLTNLLNRQAFLNSMNKLFEKKDQLKISALVMLDLDNLKFINDTHGHDCGDEYLRCTANAMRKSLYSQVVMSRMAGDEFFMFIYGYETKSEIRKIVNDIHKNIKDSFFTLPTGEPFRIRGSSGLVWYPDDAEDVDQLIKYADYAMYTAKNSQKGELCEFNKENFAQNAYLIHSREELNKLIEKQEVEYFFQPIVCTRTGTIFAYEALMRSKLATLKSPLEIINLARSQFKLYQIERLTWFASLADVKKLGNAFDNKVKIFINSVSNNMLNDDDIAEIKDKFGDILHRVVLEITESEKFDEDLSKRKRKFLDDWGAEIALDDFGTGYNGDIALLLLSPHYVKIDMSIVRNVDKDKSRQELCKNLISYSHERNIKVIAEGVETIDEMKTLISFGADYLQGYYLGKPQKIPSEILEQANEVFRSQNII